MEIKLVPREILTAAIARTRARARVHEGDEGRDTDTPGKLCGADRYLKVGRSVGS